jgi:hypothetical protein
MFKKKTQYHSYIEPSIEKMLVALFATILTMAATAAVVDATNPHDPSVYQPEEYWKATEPSSEPHSALNMMTTVDTVILSAQMEHDNTYNNNNNDNDPAVASPIARWRTLKGVTTEEEHEQKKGGNEEEEEEYYRYYDEAANNFVVGKKVRMMQLPVE